MIRVRGFALYGPLAASTRYRLGQFVPGLHMLGIELDVVHLLDNQYLGRRFKNQSVSYAGLIRSGLNRWEHLFGLGRYDLAMLHCELFPLAPAWVEACALRTPYLYDFDDAFYLKYKTGKLRRLSPLLGRKFDAVIARAGAVTAGNDELACYARRFNDRTDVLPTVVDVRRYVPDCSKKTGVFTIGWIGSPSTAPYLSRVVSPLEELGAEGRVRLVVVGGEPPAIPGVEVVAIPWSEEYEVDLINSFDVGIMPLPDDEWSKGKCAFKLIQYMACAVPVIASAVGTNKVVVTSECGLLASSDQEWVDALRRLRDSTVLRRQMGDASRQRISEQYSLDVALPRLASIIHRVAGR
jgi:glycosyltransferase involved in cell wall biosynthesis